MKKALALLICLSLIAACAAPAPSFSASSGSGTEPPPTASAPSKAPSQNQPADRNLTYSVYTFDTTYMMDFEGQPIDESEVFETCYDIATGEPRYLTKTRIEDTGEDDEYGNPVTEQYCRLYDLNEKLLYDWQPITYKAAMGELLIRTNRSNMWFYQEDFPEGLESCLWNPVTGKTVLEDVDSLQDMEGNLFLAGDASGKVLGVIDEKGNIISGFPALAEYYYPTTEHGLILTDNNSPYAEFSGKEYIVNYLLDKNFNLLLEAPSLNIGYVGLRGRFLLSRESDADVIISLDNLSELYRTESAGTTVNYYDGERMILLNGSDRLNQGAVLCGANGKPLTDAFQSLKCVNEHIGLDDMPSERFIAVDGDNAFLLDRDGNVLASASIPQLSSVQYLKNGLFSYEITAAKDKQYCGLLDENFNILLPAGKYEYISPLYSYAGGRGTTYDIFLCDYTTNNGLRRTDLLRLDASPIIEGLSYIGSVSDNRIAVMRGFSYGLIDFDGSWIAKNSVYGALGAD